MSWFFLFLAICLEVAGTTSMKLSDGFSKPLPSALMFVCYISSLGALTMTLKEIELGVAYAVWGGLGIALIATIGCLFFGEAVSLVKLGCIALIITGVVGLNLWGGAHAREAPAADGVQQAP